MRRVSRVPEVVVAVCPADAATGTGGTPGWRSAESATARRLLRTLLAELEPAARDTAVAARRGGQPYLPEWPELAVSMSHDGGHVAAAAGRCAQVGVDIQVPPPDAGPGLLQRCLHDHVSQLGPLDGRARGVALARVWTVQEACVKATGAGIAGRPWRIDVRPGDRSGRWADLCWAALPEEWAVPVAVAWSAAGPAPTLVPT